MNKLRKVENENFSTDRPLLGDCDFLCEGCAFVGDGALRACRNFVLENCEVGCLDGSSAFTLSHCKIASELNRCEKITLRDSEAAVDDFCRAAHGVTVVESSIKGDGAFCDCRNVFAHRMELCGKNAFKNCKNVELESCKIDSVDAFFGCENVTVKNSVIVCERLCASCKNVKLVNCTVVGEKPLCNCKNARALDCVFQSAAGAFCGSDIRATLRAPIDSIVDPLRGVIVAPAVGEIVRTDCNSKALIMLKQYENERR